ncbi:type I restriction enzyme HsdR N-terminal domain-containing protein [Haliscomenobacter hydrossis]|uniref:Restriction endonuclease, type I, EcoRI, R subunit/Type III n=1 Tax=Haliscomenobacter hydrossis (strain ATCC 27775 / DSM 1100 / LMG 10767 / O) TaxID=760192 RepID=F4L532_HALH1|nr:type I restriction enzyme HsdR N-terminal domain-containing protein [Haliscomenobacter hydrossis]AEE48753.1 Restriction endonuclease, type I, EcoRI, R subunit/Type III [Haliscomenobacter hydrossis DSM 1100]
MINFLPFSESLQIKKQDQKRYIFDPIRKKWLVLLPEELVRQLIVQYLVQEKGYNRNRIAIERGIKVNGLSKRCDILVFDQDMQPFLLIECKAPEISLSADVFHQMAVYNMQLRVPHLMMSNGETSYICKIDVKNQEYTILEDLP